MSLYCRSTCLKKTEKLFVQLERYSQPDIHSTPSELFYYGYNSTGYELYKEYGYTEPVSYGGYKYKHCIGENMDWYEAKSQSERNGMTLLTIDTLWELHFLKGFLQGFWVKNLRKIIPIIHFIGLQVSKNVLSISVTHKIKVQLCWLIHKKLKRLLG